MFINRVSAVKIEPSNETGNSANMRQRPVSHYENLNTAYNDPTEWCKSDVNGWPCQ